ncbi:YunG family protein [Hamadaea tsunoensis]|uniref:YunG family protein n=1 Tax=Hamadaea tsunoensis TaxID=53368 RepID=UPI0004202988|nr:hypothetical protein [Hamadaea tsunoensis]
MVLLTLATLEDALRAGWAADTCSPDDFARAGWDAGNPAWGHCDITALIVHDVFGGELIVGDVTAASGAPQGFHWWNRLDSGIEIDLTREQFRSAEVISGARPVQRPAGPLKRRNDEYRLLRRRVAERLGQPLPGRDADQLPE